MTQEQALQYLRQKGVYGHFPKANMEYMADLTQVLVEIETVLLEKFTYAYLLQIVNCVFRQCENSNTPMNSERWVYLHTQAPELENKLKTLVFEYRCLYD